MIETTNIVGRFKIVLSTEWESFEVPFSDVRLEHGDEDVLPVLGHPARVTLIGICRREYVGIERPVSPQARSLSSRSRSTRSCTVVVGDRSSRGSSPSRKILAVVQGPFRLDPSIGILKSNRAAGERGDKLCQELCRYSPTLAPAPGGGEL